MAKTLQIKLDALLTDNGSAEARRLTPHGLSFLLAAFKDDEIRHVELGASETLDIDTADALAVIVFSIDGEPFDVALNSSETAALEDQVVFACAVDAVARGQLGSNLAVRVTGNGATAANIGVWVARAG